MNVKAILTLVALVTGAYFIWSWLSRSENNPTTQPAFENIAQSNPTKMEALPYSMGMDQTLAPEGDPYHVLPVANDLPATDPRETTIYETIYNIQVDAPVIPDLNSGAIIDDIREDIVKTESDPITQATGGAIKTPSTKPSGTNTYLAKILPTGKTYTTAKALEETDTGWKQQTEIVSDPSSQFLGGR